MYDRRDSSIFDTESTPVPHHGEKFNFRVPGRRIIKFVVVVPTSTDLPTAAEDMRADRSLDKASVMRAASL